MSVDITKVLGQVYPDMRIRQEGLRYMLLIESQLQKWFGSATNTEQLKLLIRTYISGELAGYIEREVDRVHARNGSLKDELHAANEYLIAEILELGGNYKRQFEDHEKIPLDAFHIIMALNNDGELKETFRLFVPIFPYPKIENYYEYEPFSDRMSGVKTYLSHEYLTHNFTEGYIEALTIYIDTIQKINRQISPSLINALIKAITDRAILVAKADNASEVGFINLLNSFSTK